MKVVARIVLGLCAALLALSLWAIAHGAVSW